MSQTDKKLEELGIVLPKKDRRGKGMLAIRQYDDLLFVSGTGPNNVDNTPAFIGKLGSDLTIEEGYRAARLCGINMLAAVREYVGDLDRISGIMKVLGLVASSPDFYDQPAVMHGFSDLMVEVLGDRGLHARSAMGTCCLPQNIPVEVEAIFQIRD
ncbi:MAG: RidA family protein [Anaerolineaceae bacterium]|nr:MAG: RidA family protein [Anaerolineaceae bacterium]